MLLTRRSLLLGLMVPEPPPGEDIRTVGTFLAINDIRREHKRAPLAWSNRLASAARSHAERMEALGFFSHEDPEHGNLRSRLELARIGWRFCAENLFSEKGYDDPVDQAVRGWMSSAGHRANVLSRNPTHTGIGIASDRGGRLWIVQIFILPR